MQQSPFLSGVKTGLPIAFGYLPIAVAFGALALESGLQAEAAVLMSLLVYAGASQFMAVGMLFSGAGALQIIAATLFLNLRHMIMSMVVNKQALDGPVAWKALFSFGITDETFALLTLEEQRGKASPQLPYVAGLLLSAYLAWNVGTMLGCLGSSIIPSRLSAGMVIGLYAMFIGLLVPNVRRSRKTGLIAGISMLLCYGFNAFLDQGWSIVLATIVGAMAGATFIRERPWR